MRYDQLSPVPPVTRVTKFLIITCVVAFFIDFILSNTGFRPGGQTIIDLFGLVPSRIKLDHWYWQFVTYIFLHGQPLHLLLNMLILWYFGAETELKLGEKAFAGYFFLCGIGAGVFNYFVNALFSDPATLTSPIIGASGAIFGILAAYGILFGNRYFLVFFLFPMKAKYFVLIIGAIELITGVSSRSNTQDNVAHFAHLGGMFVGAAYIYLRYIYPRSGGGTGKKDAERERLKRQFTLIVNQPGHENPKPPDTDKGPYWN